VSEIVINPDVKEEEPPFLADNLVVICASPGYGYLGVAPDLEEGHPTMLLQAVALVPVQVSSRLATPNAAPAQDTALMPIIGGKAGATGVLHLSGPMPFYRVVDMHPQDRAIVYNAYLDMTGDAWPTPSDA